MKPLRIRRVSDYWGLNECSSSQNFPSLVEWVTRPGADHDYIMFVDRYIMLGVDWGFPNQLGWLLETPEINHEIIKWIRENLSSVRRHFLFIFTCLDDLVQLGPPFAFCVPNAASWIDIEKRKMWKKSKLVSLIASSKDHLSGHKHRLGIVERLASKVDVFGRGRKHELMSKADGMADYMFSVSIENDDSDSYFTEKLIDNFVVGTVPVYWGSRKAVEENFDATGVIFLDDDPELTTLSPELYESLRPSIEYNFHKACQWPISEDWIVENYLISNL